MNKKAVSLICSAAILTSAFAGVSFAANASGDTELIKCDFENTMIDATETYSAPAWNEDKTAASTREVERVTEWTDGWGAATGQSAVYYGSSADANAYMMNNIGSLKLSDTMVWTDDYATYHQTTVTPPSVTGNKSLYFATQIGMNPAATSLTLPDYNVSPTGIYGIDFDMMLVNADHQHPYFESSKADRMYTVTIGGFKICVKNGDLMYYDGSVLVDTGIDLTLAGKWFRFSLVYDETGRWFDGVITPYEGDSLAADEAVEIPYSVFAGTDTAIRSLSWQNLRTDGSNKGAVNCAIDNFTITEDTNQYNNITVNMKCGGTTIKQVTVKAADGKMFKANNALKADFTTEELRARGKYYKYDPSSIDSVMSAEGAQLYLDFTENQMPEAVVKATKDNGATEIATIGRAYALPGETTVIYANEYIKDSDGKWYQKNDNRQDSRGSLYDVTVRGGEVKNVEYKPADEVETFLEAENSVTSTGEGTYSSNYTQNYASGGKWVQSETESDNYPAGFTTDAVTGTGTYNVSVRIYSLNRTTHIYKIPREGRMIEITSDAGEGLYTYTIENVELKAGDRIHVGKMYDDGSKLIGDIDYILITKVKITETPTAEPTVEPTVKPTAEPTAVPTAQPTVKPTAEPTAVPTVEPTVKPTAEPTAVPTAEPTIIPSDGYPYTITEISVKSEEGAALQTIPVNRGFIVNTTLMKTLPRSESDYIFVAAFAQSGELLNIDYVQAKFADNYEYNVGFYIPPQEKKIKKIKAYVWNEFGSLAPLAKDKELIN